MSVQHFAGLPAKVGLSKLQVGPMHLTCCFLAFCFLSIFWAFSVPFLAFYACSGFLASSRVLGLFWAAGLLLKLFRPSLRLGPLAGLFWAPRSVPFPGPEPLEKHLKVRGLGKVKNAFKSVIVLKSGRSI